MRDHLIRNYVPNHDPEEGSIPIGTVFPPKEVQIYDFTLRRREKLHYMENTSFGGKFPLAGKLVSLPSGHSPLKTTLVTLLLERIYSLS